MKRYRTISCILLLSQLVLSCGEPPQTEEDAAHFIADFFVRFLEAEQQIKATAGFYSGDSLRTANPTAVDGGVRFQGSSMEMREVPGYGIRYSFTGPSDYQEAFRFSYRDPGGSPRELLAAMSPVTGFSVNGTPVKSSGITVDVGGGALTNREQLLFFFIDSANKAFTITFQGPVREPVYRLSAEQLGELPAGPTWLYLVKKSTYVEEQHGQTTISGIEFYTRTLAFDLYP